MKSKKMTLRQFQYRFRTEKACMESLFRLRWPNGFRCPKCDHHRYSFHSVRKLYQCSKCKYQVSVTAGTIFHKTRTPLIHWFWMIFIMTRQKSGVSMLSLQGMLGIKSYTTVWAMSHKIRKAMADRNAQHQLSGLVETIQAFLGSSERSSGKKETKERPSLVVKVEDRGERPGFAHMELVPAGLSNDTDGAIGEPRSSPGRCRQEARGPDDDARPGESYDELNPILIGDRKPRRIRWARILMANLSGNIRGVHHGVSEKHLHRYIAEFMYRFNRRNWSFELLNRALLACVSASTVTYAELNS